MCSQNAEERPKLKIPSASTQNLLLRGKRAVPRSSSQDRFRRRDCDVENIQEYLETRGQPRSRAEESSYILEKKAGRGIYILENILEYESPPDGLYSQRYSRKTYKGHKCHGAGVAGERGAPQPPGLGCLSTSMCFFPAGSGRGPCTCIAGGSLGRIWAASGSRVHVVSPQASDPHETII